MSGDVIKKYLGIAIYVIYAIFILAWGIYLQVIPNKETIWNDAYNVGSSSLHLLGAIVGFFFIKKQAANAIFRRTLYYFVLAAFFWGIADMIWAYYNIVLHVEVPFPSIADAFYIFMIMLICWGCWRLMEYSDAPITSRNIFESFFFILVGYGVVYFVFKSIPIASGFTLVEAITNFTYPMLDIFMFILAFITYKIVEGRARRSMMLLLISIIFMAIGDYAFTYGELLGTYWNGGLADLMFVASSILLFFFITSCCRGPFELQKKLK
ncbi:hypothetical protein A2334_00545 [Candidatus Roizmanbacteria bacterium RIFOXYB2_FULL_38_10]|uniref:Uncharacterized protein n=1 Tax=Candidatus Roizmanbacteria bacterium RIFOXYD1_FULL_38_12 TaxID=1802093 RepID=A0A1F7L173_9BACT|nr:MAG: hypothetical protein A3K47_03815 [Candidatus Roizmanbacteria bacterium RIFOXYA2_FULL_38_14]OGK63884.1 MAG: hypothetical protein A3K27_03815 [Candidatus Roizmanbacteria bacterium RIFOXYA1_FULL_37_12]OGK65730.1 MAG: hypothetical protein A3K38_03815 [Candidatus Roizmanbacteria bacterium RIFOXYB1_FULL_40_23]OGK68175.1 MAG: hypothetical protein A2334_00545 [Candidatus Roizmanbacteria bacterium RIFOXYB2_FULL_38_10]OGK70135.1 MAG: hypothetical protein A3K21_03820 [Candidatus Roizmanbacteria ba